MRNIPRSTFFLILIIASASICNAKNYLPIKEIQRPLSLPPKTWKLDLGFTLAPSQKNLSSAYEIDLLGLSNFQIPYLPIGNRLELYFLTPMLKIYLVKNTVIQDSFMMIDGPNFAVLAGITEIRYSYYFGHHYFDMYSGLGYQLKAPLSSNIWLFSFGHGDVNLRFRWDSTNIKIGLGFQVTDKLSIIPALSASVYRFPVHIRRGSYIGYSLYIPLDFKINMNRKRGMMFRVGFLYETNTSNNDYLWGIPIGFQYSWHW